MTLKITTLSAALALTISAAGMAMAQDSGTAPAPATESTAAPAAEPSAPAAEAPETPVQAAPPTEPAPIAPAPAAEAPAADAPAADTPATDAPAAAAAPAAEGPAADAPSNDTGVAGAEPAPSPSAAPEAVPAPTADAEPAAAEPAPAAETPAEAVEPRPEGAVTPEPAAEAAPDAAAATGAPAGDADAGEATASEAEEPAQGGDHGGGHIADINFSFEGPFGKFDQFQLQRGLQVYTEVCAACHGMRYVPLRTLADEGGPGLPEDQVRAYAANLTIIDAETEEERPREPTDHFPTISGLGMGPDLSLMAKARAAFHGPLGTGLSQLVNGIGGPEYIHAILTSYTGEEVEQAGTVLYQNTAFPSGYIQMPPPLSDDLVTYEDGTPATVDQMATDVAAFLMWAAEPKMMARKQVGLVAVLFLIVFSVLLYMTNKRLWASHKRRPQANTDAT